MKHEVVLWLLVTIAVVFIICKHKDFAASCSQIGSSYQQFSTYAPNSEVIGTRY